MTNIKMPFEQQCGKKVRHTTRREANEHKRELLTKNPNGHYNVYRCPYCTWFHVGHHSKQLVQRHRERKKG